MEPARLHFLAALHMEPNQPQVLQNLAAVLRTLNHFEAAESMAKRSVVASNNNAFCRSNLGVAQLGLKKFGPALTTLSSVVRDLPESGPAWHNYGLILYMLNRHEEALKRFDTSIALAYAGAQVRSDRSLALLALGRLQEGLEAYECRWELLSKNKIWDLDISEWKGEPLTGQRILVHHEQGFGDSIMLSRFLLTLAEKKGCQITLAVPEELRVLFQRSFRFIKVVNWDDETLNNTAAFDYHAPMLSLVRWLGIKGPSEIEATPYLFAKPLADLRLGESPYRIGICWASGNHGPQLVDRRRVISLTKFLPLSELPGVTLVSLQKGDAAKEIAQYGMEGIIYDISHKMDDFAVTADIIASLDLVVSVDTAVSHIAGAIGKPCLMLGPYTRCWRWWNKDSGWPWYNRMALYPQSADGSWDTAMRKVTKDVREARIK